MAISPSISIGSGAIKRTSPISGSILAAAQLGLVGIMFAILYIHASTIPIYIGLAAGLAAVSGFAITQKLSNKSVLFHSIVLFVSIRLVYFFSTDFRTIPFGDSYWDFGVLQSFLAGDKISVIQQPLYPAKLLTWYSSWPLLYSLETSLVQLTGLAATQIHIAVAIFLSSLAFLFGYLLIGELNKALRLRTKYLYLALVFFAASPESIFWGISSTRQEVGWLLLTMSFFFIAKIINERKRSYMLMTLLCVAGLVVAHHFSSMIAVGTFAGVAILFSRREFRGTFVTLALVVGMAMLLWWTGYATIIWQAPSVDKLLSDSVNFSLGNLRPTTYPDQLTPQWLIILLRIRDAILYASPIAGLLYLFKKRASPQVRFILLLFVIAGIMFAINLSVQALEPTRVIMLFMPVFALSAAIGFSELSRSGKIKESSVSIIAGASVAVVVFVSFIGLWGHDFAPVHLYDNSIDSLSVGEHSPTMTRMSAFMTQNVNYTHIDRIVAEDHSPLTLALPPLEFGKIRTMRDTLPVHDGRSIILSTYDLNIYKYYAGYFAGVSPETKDTLKNTIEHRLEPFDLTYSDGHNKVWK